LGQEIAQERIKYQLGFPEFSRDMVSTGTVLTAAKEYSMGKERSLFDYMKLIGMNTATKEVTRMDWCEKGLPPPGFEEYNHLYEFQQHQHLRSAALRLPSSFTLAFTVAFTAIAVAAC
jgi:hypothetical protein